MLSRKKKVYDRAMERCRYDRSTFRLLLRIYTIHEVYRLSEQARKLGQETVDQYCS